MSRRSPSPRRRVPQSRRSRSTGHTIVAAGHDVEIDITSIAAGGDGIGRADGVVVFTPRTAPGDRARVHAVSARGGRLARGTVVDLLQPALERVDPVCVHYTRDRCGGCQLQHLRYDAQLLAKGEIVRDALTRIARRPMERVAVRPSPSQWRYRCKLTLALRRSASGHWTGGLHRYDAPDEIFALEECPITEAGVLEVWHQVLRAAECMPDASALRAAIRTTADGYAFVVEGGHHWPRASEFAAKVPALTEIWWRRARARSAPERVDVQKVESRHDPRSYRARDAADGYQPVGATPASPAIGIGHRPCDAGKAAGTDDACAVPADGTVTRRADAGTTGASFVQVNAEMAAALHADVVARALAHNPVTVVDAYAGMGATALPLAERGVRVTAIEADAEAAAYCTSHLPPGSRAITARVEDVAPTLVAADVVILNPPRQGVAGPVTSALAGQDREGHAGGDGPPPTRRRPRAIIYVSCDPATLARDVARLTGWRIVAVSAFDMFPQTAHVETVCELVPDTEDRT